jgi:hypothetical protein
MGGLSRPAPPIITTGMPRGRWLVESEHSCALPEGLSTQELLWFHWLRSRERLKTLGSHSENRPPLNQDTQYSPEREREANAVVLGYELLTARMRRIESYFSPSLQQPASDTLSALSAAQLIRTNIQRGDSDEAIALFLEQWKNPEKKRGRPKGSSDSHSVTVLALQLHYSNPTRWTWPKVADQLLNCKLHTAHDSESSCTVTLKQAVTQLKRFLKELQSD